MTKEVLVFKEIESPLEGIVIKDSTLVVKDFYPNKFKPFIIYNAIFNLKTGGTWPAGMSLISTDRTPVATVICSFATSTPTSYFYCDGHAVNRTTYAALFSAIRTTFGVGDGVTTFNLPDLRG